LGNVKKLYATLACVAVVISCVGQEEKENIMVDPYRGEIQQNAVSGQPGMPSGGGVGGTLIQRDRLTKVAQQFALNPKCIYTVQLGIQPIASPGNAGQVSVAEALVTWSVGGNSVRRRVTLGKGVSLSGTGESVGVELTDVTEDGIAFPPGYVGKYQVTALVSEMPRAGGSVPPTWVPNNDPVSGWNNGRQVLAAGASTTSLTIPTNAGIVSVGVAVSATDNLAGHVIPDGSVVVEQLHALANVVKRYDPRIAPFVAWSPFADQVIVRNFNAFQIYVAIAFGIDG
jgi:hypothetical protein